MAKIETFIAPAPSIEPQRAYASPEAFAAPGQAVQKLGNALEETASAVTKLRDLRDYQYVADQWSEATTKWHDTLQQGMDDARQSGNYQDFAKNLRGQLDQDLQQRLDQAPTEHAADRLKRHFATLTDQVHHRALFFEHGMAVTDAQAKRVATLDDLSKQVYRDPTLAPDLYGQGQALIAGAGAAGLLNPEQRRKEEQAFGNALWGGAIKRGLETDPDATARDFQAGKYDPFLDLHTIEQLRPAVSSAKAHGVGNAVANGMFTGSAPAGGGDLADRIIGAEGGPDKNPNSTASGYGQFINSTWLSQLRKAAPDIAAGKSDAELLAMRGNRDLAKRMVNSYADENRAYLAGEGLPTDPGALYLAHFLGAGGAATILRADPKTPMRDLVADAVIRANPQLGNMTAGDLVKSTAAKMGGSSSSGGGGSVAPSLDAGIAAVQRRVDAHDLTPEEGDKAIATVTRRYHQWQQATAQERAQLVNDTTNAVAMLQTGRDAPVDTAAIRRLLPPEKADEVLRAVDEARDTGKAVNAVQWATPAEVVEQQARVMTGLSEPQDFARKQRFAKAFMAALDQRNQALNTDPAAYVAMAPAVDQAWQAVDPQTGAGADAAIQAGLAEQERLGVVPENRRALSKQQAAAMVRQIIGADPAKSDIGAALAGAAATYGRYWPQVFGDLVKSGLPPEAQNLAAMDRPEQAAARTDYQRMLGLIAEKGGSAKLRVAAEQEAPVIDHALGERLAAFRATVRDDHLYDAVRDGVKHLAYYYAFKGMTGEAALSQAYDGVIGRKYDFEGTIRAPKGMLGTVGRAGEAVLGGIAAAQLPDIGGNPELTGDQRRDIYLSAIRRGSWVVNEDETGLVRTAKFRDGLELPARRADGSRIEFKFAEADKLGAGQPMLPTGTFGSPF